MHDIRAIRDDPAAFDAALARRDPSYVGTAERLLALDAERRSAVTAAEAAQAERNVASKEVGAAQGRGEEAVLGRVRARGPPRRSRFRMRH